ncbi:hypothetical protein OROHE_005839 [Orobanche hederae]
MIAAASAYQWKISQINVTNAFLYGDLSEKVYMTPPPGVPHESGHVCRLRRSLYGLKHAPKTWFEKFSTVAISLGFRPGSCDFALFIKYTIET